MENKPEHASLHGIRVLVAEDNEYNQIVIQDTLEDLIKGAHVDIAENGKIAIEKHLANDYHLILMDVQMPEMDGLEATVYIRQAVNGKKKEIPIIALTASLLDMDLYKCTEAGMNAHIPKPFTTEQLISTLVKFYKNEHHIIEPANETKEASTIIRYKTGGHGVINLAFLQDFCKGDETLMKKYIDIYLRLTPGNLEKINLAINQKTYKLLSRIVHAMKAHLNYMGMKDTRALAEEIELSAMEETNLEQLPQLVHKLQYDCEKSIEELNLFLLPLS